MHTHEAADLGALVTLHVGELRILHYSATSLEKARFELPQTLTSPGALWRSKRLRRHRTTPGRLCAPSRAATDPPRHAARACKPLLGPEHDPLLLRLRHEPRAPARGSSPGHPTSQVRAASPRNPQREPGAPSRRSAFSRRSDRQARSRHPRNPLRHRYPARRSGARRRLRTSISAKACCSSEAARDGRIASCPSSAAPPSPSTTYLADARPELLKRMDPALFVSRLGRRLSLVGLRAAVQRHGRSIGIRVSPHALRHTCATHLLRGGADIRHIQKLLGHRRLTTTALYTRVASEDLRQVFAQAHPRR